MARRKRMSSVDHAWLRMDASNNLMMITGVMVFDAPLDEGRLRAQMQATLLQYPPFRSRVVREGTNAWWEEDESFDLDSHLHRVALPGKGGKHDLEAFVADLVSQRLDMSKPLWQFHLVDNYQGGQALVARIHHCIGDGMALVSVMLSMTEGEIAPEVRERNERKRALDGDENQWADWLRPVTRATVGALNATGSIAEKYLSMLTEPTRFTEMGKLVNQFAKDAAALALMPNDTPTRLKGKPGVAKAVAWNEPIPLAEVKLVGKALGCSVNDVLMACAAGAIRSYLLEHGDTLEGDADARAMIPVNLRPPGQEWRLGNKFGLVPLTLPIGIEHPIVRLMEVRARMNALKGGTQAMLAMWVLGMVGVTPKPVQREVLNMLARKATAVMTNVPGPQSPLSLAGAPLKQILFWVPQSGDIGLGVSILSYNGGVQIGVIADKKLCPDPQAICDRFAPEFEKLVMTLLTMPWMPAVLAAMEEDDKTPRAAAPAPSSIQAAPSEPTAPPIGLKKKKKSAFAAAREA
jgi:diacylglycerol O-acyltransferase / wax synthase